MFRHVDEGKKEQKKRKRHIRLPFFMVVVALVVWAPTIYVNISTRPVRYELSRVDITNVPKHDVAIVLGAALSDDGKKPSAYLQWRIDTAVNLYKAGVVERVLMTGDGSYTTHDEPSVMKNVAIAEGVPADKIEMDKFGFDTYDSCTRAQWYRGITSAIMVTQGYHLPRAVFACRAIGMDVIGVNAQSQPREGWTAYDIAREWLSTDKLFAQLGYHRLRAMVGVAPVMTVIHFISRLVQ